MKVVLLSSIKGPHFTKFLRKLSQCEHQVYVITYEQWDDQFGMPEIPDNLELISIPLSLISKPLAPFHFKKIINKIKPAVIHACGVFSYGILSMLIDYPILLTPFGSDALIYPFKSMYHKNLAEKVYLHSTLIACDCHYVKDKIREIYTISDDKVFVIPWGIDLEIYTAQRNRNLLKDLGWENRVILVMTRWFDAIYGIEYFLEALRLIAHRNKNFGVFLIGAGPLENRIKEIIREYKLETFMHLPGQVKNKELPSYLSNADIYVSSSLSDGSSVSLMEAMSFNLPAVVSDIPSNREWITDGQNGYIVPVKDPRALAERIHHLLEDEELRVGMGNQNRAIINERANWENNFRDFNSLYYKTVEYSKKKKILFMGSFPSALKRNWGGNSTDCYVLMNSDFSKRYNVLTINSTLDDDQATLWPRLVSAIFRLSFYFHEVNLSRQRLAALIFCSSRISFLEKAVMAAIVSHKKCLTLISIRSGHFYEDCKKSKLFKRLSGFLLKYVNYVVCQSEYSQKYFTDSLGLKKEKCQVVENWVATEKLLKLPFNISPDTAINETFKVLYLGDIIESKGVFDLLRAFDHCRKDPDMPALKLVLAGMGKDYDRAKEWISERALDNDITLLGYVPYAKLDDLFAGIDVFVLPSYVEGLPNSLIEAMSAGKPVITTPVGGIPDIISPGDNGIFVEPGNDRGIYESLKRILSDGEFRVTLAKNARYTASSRFKVNEAVDKFYRIIDN